MNLWEFLIAVVVVSGIVSIVRARYGISRDSKGNEFSLRDDGETERLREEVGRLRERVIVLERIATDKNHQLEAEFERLRDR
ncbi:MAG: hypothetical protein ACXWUP_06575 [Allosphingosinicella sp.]